MQLVSWSVEKQFVVSLGQGMLLKDIWSHLELGGTEKFIMKSGKASTVLAGLSLGVSQFPPWQPSRPGPPLTHSNHSNHSNNFYPSSTRNKNLQEDNNSFGATTNRTLVFVSPKT